MPIGSNAGSNVIFKKYEKTGTYYQQLHDKWWGVDKLIYCSMVYKLNAKVN